MKNNELMIFHISSHFQMFFINHHRRQSTRSYVREIITGSKQRIEAKDLDPLQRLCRTHVLDSPLFQWRVCSHVYLILHYVSSISVMKVVALL